MATRATEAQAFSGDDVAHMRNALGLARRGLGNAWPNPAVGCVVVGREGRVVGRGWTQPGGRPHAETEALARAAGEARGAVAYVTLEPCCHHGATPPCAESLIAAGVRRVVIALEDPDARVSGGGVAVLRAGGVEVTTGLLASEAADLNAGYLKRTTAGRPLVTLKTATTLDGRIATADGESRWITGEVARRWAHGLRARHDGVLIGVGTAVADDPDLTCRIPGMDPRPGVRVVADSGLRLPLGARMVAGADIAPVWLVTCRGADAAKRKAFEARGVSVVEVEPGADGRVDPGAMLAALGRRGLTRVLLEGGGRLAAALLAAGLVDRLAWFRAPMLFGGDGVPAAADLGVRRLADAPAFAYETVRRAGTDALETFRRRS